MTSEEKTFGPFEIVTTTDANCTESTYPIDYESLDFDLYQRYEKNRAVSEWIFYSLISANGILILVGATGNLLVLMAVIKEKKMRTARNTLIATLAIADLTLCIFTTPMTLVDTLTKYWPFGPESVILCKAVRTAQAVTVFFSSFTIGLIALDRHRFIVTSTKRQITSTQALLISISLLIMSLLLAAPIGIFTYLKKMFDDPGEFDYISFCMEDFPITWRMIYSVMSSLIQHILPSIIVSVAYISISRRIAERMTTSDIRQRQMDIKRKRNNIMLISVTVTHFLSWLPLNIYNMVTNFIDGDTKDSLFSSTDAMVAIYSICHTIGMSSACFNPFLYAFLNDNFRKEFVAIFGKIACVCGFFSQFILKVRDRSQSKESQITSSNERKKEIAENLCEGSNPEDTKV